MKILVAEYAVGSRDKRRAALLQEGRAMLTTLKRSFERTGNEVVFPVGESDFEAAVERLSRDSDAGLVIAPDDMLLPLTELIESNTINLGCPSECVRICVDKLTTTEILGRAGIPVPRILSYADGEHVIKPRYGCGAEGVFIRNDASGEPPGEGFIITEYIKGESLSSSLIVGSSGILPLTVNKQFIRRDNDGKLFYTGGRVPHYVDSAIRKKILNISRQVVTALGGTAAGYIGIDFVCREGDGTPYVVDVNPRPTTSIIGIARVLNYELADLILRAKFGSLPCESDINAGGCFIFNI